MTVLRSFAIILMSGILFAVGGGAFGYTLAIVAPFYYRTVFQGGDATDFNPVQVGIGLGVSQGLVAGLIIGSVVVLSVAISDFWRRGKESVG